MSDSLKTVLLITTLLLTICSTWFFFLYKPRSDKLGVIRAETQDLLLKVQSLRVNDRQVRALQAQVDTLAGAIDALREGILARNGLPFAVDVMRKKGRIYGLEFASVIPDYETLMESGEEQDGDVIRLPVHIKAVGTYRSFGRFVESLDTLPFLISLDEVKLDYEEKEYPALSVVFDVILFIRKDSQRQT